MKFSTVKNILLSAQSGKLCGDIITSQTCIHFDFSDAHEELRHGLCLDKSDNTVRLETPTISPYIDCDFIECISVQKSISNTNDLPF